ncbi:PX domain-containing protein [Aphelenchoides besseyi]|nr:PX domain-containing protein [Aphelenchoides besseyi]KAI6209638.1 PX domain-containing protein [Aphelenchoides besseyi]
MTLNVIYREQSRNTQICVECVEAMIHISVPTYLEQCERSEPHKKYHIYDLFVNGAYHASVRYSALYALHEKLLETFGMRLGNIEFPPKRVWKNLDAETVNKRREGLAKYFHGVLQNPDISKHPILERAFLDFQLNSFLSTVREVKLEVFLPDGSAVQVESHSDDPTNVVMKKLSREIDLRSDNLPHFGLFLIRDRTAEEGRVDSTVKRFDQICVRWLKNFESPYVSQQLMNRGSDQSGVQYRLGIRKVLWDPIIEEPLLDDPGALRLLYLQAVNDLQRGVFCVCQESKEKLIALQKEEQWKQFMHVCHKQASYGYEILAPVRSDYPVENTIMNLKIGRRQLFFEFREQGVLSQLVIKSTRIRIWRVSHNDSNVDMSFQIEFLVDKQTGFRQIVLYTSQAVLLSLFLQAIAAEILHDLSQTSPARYKFNDELQSKVVENLQTSKANSIVSGDYSILHSTEEQAPANLFRIISHQMPFGDESFEDIGDDDL